MSRMLETSARLLRLLSLLQTPREWTGSELADRLTSARGAGISDDAIILDPGIGFAKTGQYNWHLLAALD